MSQTIPRPLLDAVRTAGWTVNRMTLLLESGRRYRLTSISHTRARDVPSNSSVVKASPNIAASSAAAEAIVTASAV